MSKVRSLCFLLLRPLPLSRSSHPSRSKIPRLQFSPENPTLRKSLKTLALGTRNHPISKKVQGIWKSAEVDCDWFSNDEIPSQREKPDRHGRSGGCAPGWQGSRWNEARLGTVALRKPPGADHLSTAGPHGGGNGCQSRRTQNPARSGGRAGNCPEPALSAIQPVLRVRRIQGRGTRDCVAPDDFLVACHVVVFKCCRGPGGPRRAELTHAQRHFTFTHTHALPV